MRIERRFTREGQSPYADIAFKTATSEIRNPDGSVVFRLADIAVPEAFSQVATDILAQKYFRKAGVPSRLKRVEEETVPSWLWRSQADEAALAELPEGERSRFGNGCAPGVRPACRHLDLLGLEGRLFRQRSRCARLLRRIALHARHADGGAEFAAMVQHRPALGLWHRWSSAGPLLCRFRTGKLVRSKSAYEHPQPHACFIQSVEDDLVNEGGIMDLWVREARLFKYGSGTGSNFSRLRGEGEKLSGGGSSSGLMSFLKIGDRAAGAIKSGGTTRRAAKMVVVDIDHPDIESYIDWKVREEQKVAALVTGSKALSKHLKAIMKACVNCEGTGDDCFDPKLNPALKREIRAAKKAAIPENYIKRVIQLARQGYTRHRRSRLRHRLGFGSLSHRLRPELQQFRLGQGRIPARGGTGRRLEPDRPPRRPGDEDAEGPRIVGEDRQCRLGVRRSGPAFQHHHERLAHLPGGGADQRIQSVLGIHVPRRHGLQPCLAEPACIPQQGQGDGRPTSSPSMSTATSMPAGCG